MCDVFFKSPELRIDNDYFFQVVIKYIFYRINTQKDCEVTVAIKLKSIL